MRISSGDGLIHFHKLRDAPRGVTLDSSGLPLFLSNTPPHNMPKSTRSSDAPPKPR